MATIRNWRGGQLVRHVHRAFEQRLHVAGLLLRDGIRADISIPGHGIPAPPGLPPHYQTGALWKSWDAEDDARNLHTRVGSDSPIARYQEFGTSRNRPHPHGRRALIRHLGDLRRILCAPL